MIESDPLRMMFERGYIERQHNVLAIYPTFRIAKEEFAKARSQELPAYIKFLMSDMAVQFPKGNKLRFMHMSEEMDLHRLMGWELVDYFVHESMREKWWYDRLIQMLACRVRSK